eukprot:2972289-Pyramimonas_sp.AAC.1
MVSRGVPWCHGAPLSEIDSEIGIETDSEIERCPVVSRGVPLREIDGEIDSEIDKCPVVSRGVPL